MQPRSVGGGTTGLVRASLSTDIQHKHTCSTNTTATKSTKCYLHVLSGNWFVPYSGKFSQVQTFAKAHVPPIQVSHRANYSTLSSSYDHTPQLPQQTVGSVCVIATVTVVKTTTLTTSSISRTVTLYLQLQRCKSFA